MTRGLRSSAMARRPMTWRVSALGLEADDRDAGLLELLHLVLHAPVQGAAQQSVGAVGGCRGRRTWTR